jgi:hypothetical protein
LRRSGACGHKRDAEELAKMYGTVAAIAAYYGMMFVGDAAGLPQIVTMGIQVRCRQ